MGDIIKFHYPASFMKAWQKLGLTDEDQDYMERLLQEFADNKQSHTGKPFLGDMISGTGGAIKWRFSPESTTKGKSGSERVIYLILTGTDYFFIDVYGKNQKDSLTEKEKAAIKVFSRATKKSFKRKD